MMAVLTSGTMLMLHMVLVRAAGLPDVKESELAPTYPLRCGLAQKNGSPAADAAMIRRIQP